MMKDARDRGYSGLGWRRWGFKRLGLALRAMGSHGRLYPGGKWQGLGLVLDRNPSSWVGAEWIEVAPAKWKTGWARAISRGDRVVA